MTEEQAAELINVGQGIAILLTCIALVLAILVIGTWRR